MTLTYGFDFGISGFAAVIRKGSEFVWARSYVFPDDFASTKKSAEKRRLSRTRKAHRAREWWWNEQAKAIGLEILKDMQKSSDDYRTVKVDERLQREFPKVGDETIFTSCLLRCKLITDGAEHFEPWQLYKAVHSSIQKRGYDSNIPWKSGVDQTQKKEEDEIIRLSEFTKHLREMGLPEKFQYPCFFEAFKMGLWTPDKGIIGIRQNCTAEHAGVTADKGYTAPREMVEREIRMLLEKIRERYPALDTDLVMYGLGKVQYASHQKMRKHAKAVNLRPGTKDDWQGVLGQKIPRFDNRIIAKCLLMPRFGVCKAEDAIYQEFHLNKSIHNIRVVKQGESIGRKITHSEFTDLRDEFLEKKTATEKQLEKALAKMQLKVEGSAYPLEAAKTSGRSSFCRPALRILNELLVSGKSPKEIFETLKNRPRAPGHTVSVRDNTEATKGLTLADLNWLTKIQSLGWSEFYLPQERYDAALNAQNKDEGIRQTTENLNNPVVRHRIQLFIKTLREMNVFISSKYDTQVPDSVALEFVRDDFLGAKAKKELQAFQKFRRNENEEANKRAKELGLAGYRAVRKLKLWERQGGIDPYDMRTPIGQTEIDNCEVDHIVPVEIGGPDAEYNVVLTRRTNNQNKANKTPHTWLSSDKGVWQEYVQHIERMTGLSHKVRKLLVAENALDLVERYQGLAETAWIARLAGTIVNIEMGWKPLQKDSKKNIQVIAGSLTARVRRENGLNVLLNTEGNNTKNRGDIRHHILDAMVISFCKVWARDPQRERYFKLPAEVSVDTFKRVLAAHRPIEIPKEAELEENFYGLDATGALFHKRYLIRELAYKAAGPGKMIFDKQTLNKWIVDLEEKRFHPEIVEFLKSLQTTIVSNPDNPEAVWLAGIEKLRLKNGSKPRYVKLYADLPEEAKILAKQSLHGTQVIKPKGAHKGFVICLETKAKKPVWKAKPIYVWQHKSAAIAELRNKGFEIRFIVRSGEYVDVRRKCGEIDPGIYKVASVKNGQQFKLMNTMTTDKSYLKNVNLLVNEGDIQLAPAASGPLL